jgi:hypothetical protein
MSKISKLNNRINKINRENNLQKNLEWLLDFQVKSQMELKKLKFKMNLLILIIHMLLR